MYVTINRRDRDAIYDGLMTDLTTIGDMLVELPDKRTYRVLVADKKVRSRHGVADGGQAFGCCGDRRQQGCTKHDAYVSPINVRRVLMTR